jgi:hypothetical protein
MQTDAGIPQESWNLFPKENFPAYNEKPAYDVNEKESLNAQTENHHHRTYRHDDFGIAPDCRGQEKRPGVVYEEKGG